MQSLLHCESFEGHWWPGTSALSFSLSGEPREGEKKGYHTTRSLQHSTRIKERKGTQAPSKVFCSSNIRQKKWPFHPTEIKFTVLIQRPLILRESAAMYTQKYCSNNQKCSVPKNAALLSLWNEEKILFFLRLYQMPHYP